MTLLLIGGGIKRCFCLTSVAYIGPNRGLGRPKLAEVAHVTRDLDTTFQVQAALVTAVLARQAAAAVGVRTCWPWETADRCRLLGGGRCFVAPGEGEERGGGIPWRPPTYSLFSIIW